MNNWRTETRGNIRFHLVDNMELMNSRPDKYWDLAICDPPYGIGADKKQNETAKNREKANGRNKSGRGWKLYRYTDWDNEKPKDEYFKDLFRISKKQIIWGGNYFSFIWEYSNSFLIWNKMQREFSLADGELAWVSEQNKAMRTFDFSRGAAIADNNKYYGRIHPTQKPVALYRWLLQRYAKEGDKILDTHGGSFTHAIACDMEGFELDICETDEEYFNNGLAAFDKYKAQTCIEFPTQMEGIQLTI